MSPGRKVKKTGRKQGDQKGRGLKLLSFLLSGNIRAEQQTSGLSAKRGRETNRLPPVFALKDAGIARMFDKIAHFFKKTYI
jgi:hypothetical protein